MTTDNVKLDIYNAIEAAINDIPEFKNVRKYNSQDLNEPTEIPRNYPQAFIYFPSIEWKPLMMEGYNQNLTQEQKGDIIVAVRVSLYSLKDNEDTFKPDFALIQSVYRSLSAIKGENFTQLHRVFEEDDINNNNVRTWEIQFTTSVVECGVSKGQEDAQGATIVIDGNFS